MKKTLQFGPIVSTYTGKIFSIKERQVTRPDGTTTTFEYCERPASVSVLAFNKKNELLMIKEKRHPKQAEVWFLPGGRMDKVGETPRKAAIRELREETGYTAKSISLIHKKSPSTTLIWDIYIFAAKDLQYSPLPQESGEVTTPVFIPFKKAITMALDGTIENEFISYNIIRFAEMIKRKQFEW